MNNITIIIPTMNSVDNIKKVLDSCKEYKVIIIDKSSPENKKKIIQICTEYDNVKLFDQKSEGLGAARNEGLKKVRTKYVMMLGADNILTSFGESKDLRKIVKYMESKNWVGCAFQTRTFDHNKYLGRCLELRWSQRFKEGSRTVIGTPAVYNTKILKKYAYDDDMDYADDADLGERLKSDRLKQGYSPYYVYDITPSTVKDIKYRFTKYGESDRLFYKKYIADDKWPHSKVKIKKASLVRKIKSWLHPAVCEFLPVWWYFPFYLMIVWFRYFGYIRGNK